MKHQKHSLRYIDLTPAPRRVDHAPRIMRGIVFFISLIGFAVSTLATALELTTPFFGVVFNFIFILTAYIAAADL